MEKNELRESIKHYLREDIGRGDITSESIFSPEETGKAALVARESCIVAGIENVAAEVFITQNPSITFSGAVADGTEVEKDCSLLTLNGPIVDLLKAERVALNLLQRLCGIATLTRKYVEKVKNYNVSVVDTRKTTPGLRMLEKYAVTVGGGRNHRFNLTDGVLIKDNHIAACGSIFDAVQKVRSKVPHTVKIEVETDTMDQVEECLRADVDIIMFDNMSPSQMEKAVNRVDGQALTEASGGVNLQSIENIAKTGVDFISVGALTHSVIACDIGMDWLI